MIDLKQLTVICVDCYNYGGAIAAIKKCQSEISAARFVLLTDIPIKIDGIEIVKIPTISSKREYSRFIVKELYKYFDTSHCLVIQHDGYILDGSLWDDKFISVDYIGASWIFDNERPVGNGGFSIRSHRLQKILGEDSMIDVVHPEDQSICVLYRFYLEEKYGIVFADEELADKFSFELKCPIQSTFGFHGNFHKPYHPTIVIKRTGAMGDVIQVEPVMQYFHDKGYRVVLDTLPQFNLLFVNHYFKVHTLQEIDQRLLKTAKFVNLDMAYESQPEKLHLQSYFDYCGIEGDDYKEYIKTPTLSIGFPITKDTRLFKKYCVIHVDNRAQGGRRIHGVNWGQVVECLISFGYTPIQIGKDDTATIRNAIQINCTNEHFLSYVVAGADLMIGIDSGPSHLASAFKVPSIVFSGSVDLRVIHADLSNITWLHNHDKRVCDKAFCWHSVVGTEGVKCYLNEEVPPCSIFSTETVIQAIKKHVHGN